MVRVSVEPETAHSTEDVVVGNVNVCYDHDWMVIDGGSVLAIASWWQSSGRIGIAFAELASTNSVDYDRLIEDIEATYPECLDDDSRRQLDMLRKWADRRAVMAKMWR